MRDPYILRALDGRYVTGFHISVTAAGPSRLVTYGEEKLALAFQRRIAAQAASALMLETCGVLTEVVQPAAVRRALNVLDYAIVMGMNMVATGEGKA